MDPTTRATILCCADCGSRLIELRGPVNDEAVVRCAQCGAAAGRWPQFLCELEARIEEQRQGQRRRRLH